MNRNIFDRHNEYPYVMRKELCNSLEFFLVKHLSNSCKTKCNIERHFICKRSDEPIYRFDIGDRLMQDDISI